MINFILQITGFGWAIIGLANIFMAPQEAQDVMEVVIIFNMVFFILPGLLVGGIVSNKS